MNDPIPQEELEAVWLRAAHRLIAQLHVAKAESGLSFAEIGKRIAMPVEEVASHFWNPECYREIKPRTDLAWAMGREVFHHLPARLAAPMPDGAAVNTTKVRHP